MGNFVSTEVLVASATALGAVLMKTVDWLFSRRSELRKDKDSLSEHEEMFRQVLIKDSFNLREVLAKIHLELEECQKKHLECQKEVSRLSSHVEKLQITVDFLKLKMGEIQNGH